MLEDEYGVACACTGACFSTGICPLHGGIMFTQEEMAEQRVKVCKDTLEHFFKTRTVGPTRIMLRFTHEDLIQFYRDMCKIAESTGMIF